MTPTIDQQKDKHQSMHNHGFDPREFEGQFFKTHDNPQAEQPNFNLPNTEQQLRKNDPFFQKSSSKRNDRR